MENLLIKGQKITVCHRKRATQFKSAANPLQSRKIREYLGQKAEEPGQQTMSGHRVRQLGGERPCPRDQGGKGLPGANAGR